MEIKFTTLEERHIHMDTQIYDLCMDRDLNLGEGSLRNVHHGKDNEKCERTDHILKTAMVFNPDNYVEQCCTLRVYKYNCLYFIVHFLGASLASLEVSLTPLRNVGTDKLIHDTDTWHCF
jgi:hypothetical protein